MSCPDSTTGPGPSSSRLLPLLETLQDDAASPGSLTDALLTLTNRLTGEEGKEFSAEVGKYFPQLYKIFKTHIPTENSDLSSAALQALGFCVFNAKIASQLCETEIQELLSIVSSVAVKASDKNIRTRALWVISKQSFPPDVVGEMVPSIITMLETILNKGDLLSMVVEYEALNVIIRLIEQAPSCMEEQAVRWAKLIVPLVVHSAHKVQLRGATALEMGMPLLLQKQQEVAAVTEELMTTKVIPELQKLFSSKNDTYVLKLWPLFVKLLGKTLHRSGSFINSLLQLEELGFRSGSLVVKKIAFIAWKSLIDNFALNPEILCSAKRLKLLMQPLSSIHVRTEALALTKLEVWWYLLMRLGPQLPAHFEQVCVPLIQSTLGSDASLLQGNSSRLSTNQSLATPGSAQKSGAFPFGTPVTPRMTLNSSTGGGGVIPAIQLLGIEMLLHFFLGPEVVTFAKENKVVLSLEPLQYSVITSPSFFCKHANTFINAIQDDFIAVGKDVSDIVLNAIWKGMIGFVRAAVESGSKKERQSSEVLTMLLQALKTIVMSNELPVLKSLSLMEITIKELPSKVLGSPAYQVANMDLLNGTPALFLIQLSFHKDLLECFVQDERFFLNYESLVSSVLSGPISPLAFSESVFIVVNQSATYLENKEHLWRIWSIVVNPLTEWINQTNEVNQGDALEHNFSAIYSMLLLPVSHIFPACEFPQPTMKSLLRSWSELYKAFARCASLVATAEDNLCCEELCAKIISELDKTQINRSMLDGLSHITSIMVDCINFAPYGTKSQPPNKSPQTPTDWSKKKKDPLGKLSSLIRLVAVLISSAHILWSKEPSPEKLVPVAASVVSILQNIIGHIFLSSVIRSVFEIITKPLAVFYEKARLADGSRVNNTLSNKFEKLWVEIISCLQSHYTGPFESQLLQELSPLLCIMFTNKNKQIRSQAAQFWNATFGKATTLVYPEELKSILCQTKQKILLLLPGFESTEIMGESNGTYSDSTENSQWNTKISGIEVNSSGKRDSLLAQSSERKEENTNCHVPPAKTKLEFSLPKTNRKDVILEEENTVDFVFIPPETKERVLTEHQKEVLQTKRVDIPTMYNNLDASQDTALFSQYTQDQEASLVKPTLVDTKEEDGEEEGKEISQAKKVGNILLGAENCKPNGLQEKTESTAIGQFQPPAKHSPDLNCEDSESCTSKTVPEEPSVLDQSVNESSSSVSSSSSSSDVISGTPQPVSRRQSFITLEKFDSSENRPFSPSKFNHVSRPSQSTPSLDGQENMIGTDTLSFKEKSSKSASKPQMEETVSSSKRSCPESIDALESSPKAKKAKEESKPASKLQSESALGIQKSSLRQNKIELSEDKKAKLMALEQEKNMQVSTSKDEVGECDLLGETQEPQCMLDVQSQASDVEIIESTTMEKKHVLNNVAEMKAGLNLDSKENTPPEVTVLGDAISVGQTPQIPPNQKILRRSLRRKPETTEGSADSQDKENSQQKKDRRKDDEKLLPKKSLQSKEDSTHKQKSLPEKNPDIQGSVNKKESHAEKLCMEPCTTSMPQSVTGDPAGLENSSSAMEVIGTKESHASKNLPEETNISTRKSEGSNPPETDDLQDPCADTTHEKRIGLPRYQTRRASQGLLSSIENSESDSSEMREDGTKKKRSGRWKVTSSSLESQVKEELESQSQELHSQETANELQTSLVGNKGIINHEECMEIALPSDNNEEKEKNVPSPNDHLEGKETVDASICGGHSDAEQTVGKVAAKPTLASASKTKQITKGLDQQDAVPHGSKSGLTELSGDACPAVPNGFSASINRSETPECLHKRSKRMRRSKGCDCCGEKPTAQLEKSPTVVKKASSPEPKSKEPKKTSSKAAVVASYLPAAEESHSAEKLSMEPCATSTPRSFTGDPADTENLSRSIEATGELPGSYTSKDESKESSDSKSNSFKSCVETVDCVDASGETSELSSIESTSKELIAPCQGSESKLEPVVTIGGAVHHSGHLEDRSHTEVDVNQAEKTKSSEPITDVVQDGVEKTLECSVGSPVEAQDTDMDEEESIETNVPVALTGPETSGLIQDEVKENNNIDSPLKLKEFDALTLTKISESPNGVQSRCMWSPSASPSTSILKRGVKRHEEEDSSSPANKSRRVSFANPIYQEELADDIDRRSPAVRNHSSNGSPSSRSIKPSSNHQTKPITTPTKGPLSPGSRSHKYKSSKKCLISEMVKETLPSPTESIYPALQGCKAPVDTILPQITSNIWARGLGQLIRAKNIRTVGDLSSLTAAEIKTLPIRSPKVSNVRRALKGYHEQQLLKYRGFEEIVDLDDTEKPVSDTDEKPFPSDDEKVAADLSEPMTTNEDAQSPSDLLSQINVLAAQITSENLHSYSGSELFEMQEKLYNMTNCIMKNLQSRWKSPPHESTV
ncbi:PREDICTED: telomere-associated protein RIF1 [Gekko japonicus]|uniref:Telomere-associated protein RIF1 n=1 Tax=Gekko japonicus TaxID=146911 RepID=A0ABM1JW77_GEKJA|nr:PREDICTED: telomere-associated protein RIF1 [Gekko japonicus]